MRLAVALLTQIGTIWETLYGMVRGVGGTPAAIKGRGSHGSTRPYPQPVSSDIEARVCTDQPRTDEDVLILSKSCSSLACVVAESRFRHYVETFS